MKKVLITGAAGFIGRHVAREYIKKGWHVIGIGRGDWLDWREYGLSNWHKTEISLASLEELGGNPDVIIHCAGGSSVEFSMKEPAVDFELTVCTTSIVLEYMRVHSPSTKLVYPSSAAVYGQVKSLPISEGMPLNPISPYGCHKKMSEDLCKLYSLQYGLSISIVRMFSIYGLELRKQLLWDACQKFSQGKYDFFGSGEEIRDFLHVNDVSKLLYIAAENASSHCTIVNAGSGYGVKVKEVLQLMIDGFDIDITPRFSSKPKAGDPDAYIASISKAKALGWNPLVKVQEGIKEYVDWYKLCQKFE